VFPGAEFVGLLITLFIFLVLIRGLLSWFPQAIYSEPGRLVVTATEWFLGPIRRVIPPMGGIDVSFIVAILILYLVRAVITSGGIIRTFLSIIGSVLFLLIILMAIRVALFFFHTDPWHPMVQMVTQASEPFARPFRGWFPKRRNEFDWAPVAGLAVLIVLWLVVSNVPTFGLF
jgi:YggT family protein